ncbi:hypothetical protein AABB24_003131 [Solanum stoloniferum]|uniref:Uncharacterized protein n=1 Tax=Solanum stoloniferum TaxID=62892 RepID=A0ABD2V5V1_9SOLN
MTFDEQQMALGCKYVYIFFSSKVTLANFITLAHCGMVWMSCRQFKPPLLFSFLYDYSSYVLLFLGEWRFSYYFFLNNCTYDIKLKGKYRNFIDLQCFRCTRYIVDR